MEKQVWMKLVQGAHDCLQPVQMKVGMTYGVHYLKGLALSTFVADLPAYAAEQHLTISLSAQMDVKGQHLNPLADLASEIQRLSSPAVPLSLSILLFFPLAIRIVLRAHHYHRFLIQASYSRTRRPHYQHQEAGLPPIQISTLWTLPWPRPRRASPVTWGQTSEMLQGRGQVRS